MFYWVENSMSNIESEKNLKRYMKLLNREQKYKNKLLDLQSKKLLDDFSSAKEVERIQELLETNQKRVQRLANSSSDEENKASLIAILDTQLFEMQGLLTEHKRKLVAYKHAAQIFKIKLDKVLTIKDDLQKELNAIKELDDGIYAIKLGENNRVSEFQGERSVEHSDNPTTQDVEEPSILTLKNKVGEALLDMTLPPEDEELEISKTIQLSNDHQIEEIVRDTYLHSETSILNNISDNVPSDPFLFNDVQQHPDGRDDLTLIKGVGSKFEALLNANGITTIIQIAEWTEQEVKIRDARLVFRGRIKREKWVEQAKALLEEKRLEN
jgi:predicted flap endonuclease-1-like 5' DNA nuclease